MEQLKELRIQVKFRVFGDDNKKKFINAFVQSAVYIKYIEPLLGEMAEKAFYSYAHFLCPIDIKSVPEDLLEVVIAMKMMIVHHV